MPASSKNETVRIAFRVDTFCRPAPEVVAFFPDFPARDGMITCYAHVGQHSEASRAYLVRRTRMASPAEYADLLSELTRIYHDCAIHIIKSNSFRRVNHA